MKKNNKKFDYFNSLVQMSQYALEEARLLKELIADYQPDQLAERVKQMHEIEHKCDMVKHDMNMALVKEFLPPIDREDLSHIAHVADNLTDSVESVVVFFYMANITQLRDDAIRFAELIIQCCEGVVKAFSEFANFKKSTKLRECLVELNDLEEKGDKLYIDAVRKLSTETKASGNVIECIEWRDIYRNFERCCDSAESVADNIESVILKNA